MISNMGHIGIFEISCRNKVTGVTEVKEIRNKIPNDVLNKLINPLTGALTDLTIKYFAVGTGAGVTSDTQSTLNAEVFRTLPVEGPALTTIGKVETGFIILDSEANVNIREVGIFVGTAATLALNSGILLSRVEYTKDKNPNEELSIKRVDIIGRG